MSEKPSTTPEEKSFTVLNLKERLANTPDGFEPPTKIKRTFLLQKTSEVMCNFPIAENERFLWPKFDKKFHVKKNDAGEHVYLEEAESKVLHYVSPQKIIDAIMDYWRKQAPWLAKTNVVLSENQAKESMRFWASGGQSFSAPIEAVLEKGRDGFCFHRLDFDFDFNLSTLEGDCPAFFELFNRITNAEAFLAWIGSLFDAQSSRQQYVWLYGDGRNGKSTLGRILAKLMGPSVRFEHPPEKSDKFWTHGLLGKRLIIFGDCNNYAYPSTGQFKALTGEDQIRLEAKGQPSFSTTLGCKFLFFSNEKPHVNGGESGRRRVIFCEVGKITTEFGKNYEDILWLEVPKFIAHCITKYRLATAHSSLIATDTEAIDSLISIEEEKYEYFVEENLVVHEEDRPPGIALLTPIQLQEKFQRWGILNHRDQRNYIAYMQRNFGIKKARESTGKRGWFYTRCSAKKFS